MIGIGLRMALGVLAGLGLSAVGVLVLPPLLVPGGPALGARDGALLAPAEVPPPGRAGVDEPAPPSPDAGIEATPPPNSGVEAPPPPPEAGVEAPPLVAAAPSADPPPRFDTVRLEPDGSGLVAGRAAPNAPVAVLADQSVVAEAEADADGRFVAFLSIAPSDAPRALALRDGAGRLSEETVILAPTGEGRAAARAPAADPPADAPGTAPGLASLDAPDPGPALRATARGRDDPGPALRDAPPAAGSPSGAGLSADPGPALAQRPTGAAPAPAASLPEALAQRPAEPIPSAAPGAGTRPPAPEGPSLAAQGPVAPAPLSAPGAGPEPAPAAPVLAEPAAAPPLDAAPAPSPVPDVAPRAPALPAPEATEAPGQPPVLLSDAEGVRLLQPALPAGAGPEVLSTVALDAIAYDGSSEVVLSGRGRGGTVRLYLDNRPAGEALIGEDGRWTATLPEAEPGRTYTLRLDQLGAGGRVESRIETPFQRQERASLEAAMAAAGQAGRTVGLRVVQPGNSLWAIARERYGEPLMYLQVLEANRDRIRDPDLIYPGQVFVLPATGGR